MASDIFIATKDELYRFVENLTEHYDEQNESEFTTSSISDKLNISRNLASQYLNEFAKEGIFVKVNSRPVYFFDKRSLEKKYEIRLEQSVFFSVAELLEILRSGRTVKRGFEKGRGFFRMPVPKGRTGAYGKGGGGAARVRGRGDGGEGLR